jgi:hypothetical protein
MLFRRFREKPLKTVWRLSRNGNVSSLVGTAHFFPHSFRLALERLFAEADHVIFEGPLDDESMERVVRAGSGKDAGKEILSRLDPAVIDRLADILVPACRSKNATKLISMMAPGGKHPGVLLINDMAPWLAFFSIYIRFVRTLGWRHSVDMEAYRIALKMGKPVIFLETIDEQIETLASLSNDSIIDFFGRIDKWEYYSKKFVEWYLAGEVEKIKANRFNFPTRRPSVIDFRDERFCDRADPYFRDGGAVFCVGVPHIPNMSRILGRRNYHVQQAL